MAKKKAKKKGKAKAKNGRKKKGLPPILKAWKECRDEVGAKPFVKMPAGMKRKAQACVDRKMRAAAMKGRKR